MWRGLATGLEGAMNMHDPCPCLSFGSWELDKTNQYCLAISEGVV